MLTHWSQLVPNKKLCYPTSEDIKHQLEKKKKSHKDSVQEAIVEEQLCSKKIHPAKRAQPSLPALDLSWAFQRIVNIVLNVHGNIRLIRDGEKRGGYGGGGRGILCIYRQRMEEECWLNMSGSEREHCLVKLMGIGYGQGYGTEDCGYG